MKEQRIFPSMILIGFGLYFFLQHSSFDWHWSISIWPTTLVIIGLAFIIQGYGGKDYGAILPGILFIGIGIHFYLVENYRIQLDDIGVMLLFISLGFLLRYQKTNSGLFYGVLFLTLALLQLFYNVIMFGLGVIGVHIANFHAIFPIILIIIGLYIFFFKKK